MSNFVSRINNYAIKSCVGYYAKSLCFQTAVNGKFHALAAFSLEITFGIYWIGECVGPRTSLNSMARSRFIIPAESRTLTVQH
jgi:hypothetical protein